MTRHITHWLEAYLDGELHGLPLRQVETHLADCEPCRAELEQLRALSDLLAESPAAENLTPPERFVAQVRLQLPPRPVRPVWRRALKTGWQLAPFGLLGTWVFAQAVFFVSGLLAWALQLGLGGEAVASLIPAPQQESWLRSALQLSDASLGNVGQIMLQALGNGGPLGWGITLSLVSFVVIGLLYWSWLASWWAYRQHKAAS